MKPDHIQARRKTYEFLRDTGPIPDKVDSIFRAEIGA